jgi:hypothetical protein
MTVSMYNLIFITQLFSTVCLYGTEHVRTLIWGESSLVCKLTVDYGGIDQLKINETSRNLRLLPRFRVVNALINEQFQDRD